jgi:hypothetical protein
MWIPKTEQDIISATQHRALEETSVFDAKKELPTKNQEIAKDIASMANDGGVIVYGIDEDENNRPCIPNPIPLAGQPERISSIVRTSITEPPQIEITTIPSNSDASKGFIVVYIPLSERAPHMVVVKGEHRYYGRTAAGNTSLSEAEVARLYARRRQWEVNQEQLLDNEIKNSPVTLVDGYAYLYIFAKPLASSEKLLEQATKSGQNKQSTLQDLITLAATPIVFPKVYSPDFSLPSGWIQRTEGLLAKMGAREFKDPGNVINIQIDFDGSGHLFCGRAAEQEGNQFIFFAEIVAGNAVRFFTLLGELYDKASYIGSVDIGVGIIGIKGSVPHSEGFIHRWSYIPYDRNEYRCTERASAIELKTGSKSVAKRLLMPLFDAMSQGHLNPFRDLS